MTLWDPLFSLVFFIAALGAADSERRVGVGRTRASKLQPQSHRLWQFSGLYFSALFWIFLAAIPGEWITIGCAPPSCLEWRL